MLLKNVYDKLVAKVNNIDISDFVSKAIYQTNKIEIENNLMRQILLKRQNSLN